MKKSVLGLILVALLLGDAPPPTPVTPCLMIPEIPGRRSSATEQYQGETCVTLASHSPARVLSVVWK